MRVLTILFMLCLLSCEKKDVENELLSSSIKEKFFFQKGSYWIYRDSISGRVDSFYLDSVAHREFPPTSYRMIDQEYFKLFITQASKFYPNDTIIWEMGFYAPSLLNGIYRRKTERYNANINNLYVVDFLNPVVNNNYLPKDDSEIITKIPNLALNLHSFKDVTLVGIYKRIDGNIGATYYINDSVGYIKMRIHYDNDTFKVNEVWELQRWHVIK